MKDEEIDTMQAGTELNALIAGQFFGGRFGYYSLRIDYAWQVVEKMESLGHWCQTQTPFGAIGSLQEAVEKCKAMRDERVKELGGHPCHLYQKPELWEVRIYS